MNLWTFTFHLILSILKDTHKGFPTCLATCCILYWIKVPTKWNPLFTCGTVQLNPKMLSGLNRREEIRELHRNKITCSIYMYIRSARYYVIYLLFWKSTWTHLAAVLHPSGSNIIEAERKHHHGEGFLRNARS